MIQEKNDHPYIIAIAFQETSMMKFYIDLEKRLISVSKGQEGKTVCLILIVYYILQLPKDFSFDQVMDFLFKTYKVFNIPYNPKLKAFMNFFEYYIYKQSNARRLVPLKYHSFGNQLAEISEDAA